LNRSKSLFQRWLELESCLERIKHLLKRQGTLVKKSSSWCLRFYETTPAGRVQRSLSIGVSKALVEKVRRWLADVHAERTVERDNRELVSLAQALSALGSSLLGWRPR
jgi:hypothetical protein